MPGNLGEATLYLNGDGKQLKADVDTAKASTQASLAKLGKGMQTSGALITAGITAPLVAMGVVSVSAASDLGESINAVNVVFEEGADRVKAYGETAAETVGLSNQEFNSLATVTGAFLQNVGFNADTAGLETIKLTERAADMASVFNTDVSSALGAIQSGLKGEFNPLEQFGVKLNAAAIEARAMEMGLADANGTLSDSAKATAALELVYEQTSKVQGDFINTSDGLANSQRISKAQMADAAAVMGAQLLPIALALSTAISNLATWFMALSPEVQRTVLIVAAVVAGIGPLLMIVGTLITSISAIIPVVTAVAAVMTFPLIAIIAAVIAIIALLALAWSNNWGGIREKTFEAVEAVKTFISNGLNLIREWWDAHGAAIMAAATAAWEAIKATIKRITDIIALVFAAFRLAFEGDWTGFGKKLREAWDATWKLITDAVSKAWELLKAGVKLLIDNTIKFFTETDWGKVGRNIVEGIAKGIIGGIHAIRNAALRAAEAAWNAVNGFFNNKSPSKLMAIEGMNFDAGLAKGIDNNVGMVVKSALSMSAAAAKAGSVTTHNYSLTGQYAYQPETTIMDQVRLLRLMEDSR